VTAPAFDSDTYWLGIISGIIIAVVSWILIQGIKYLLNPPKKMVRIPLTDLINKSKIRRSISLDTLSMTEPLNFVKLFRQSALDGELTVWGHQMGFGNMDRVASPETTLQDIPVNYWKDHEIDWKTIADPNNDNAKISTSVSANYRAETKAYRDLHVDQKQGYSWVKRNQSNFRKVA